MLTVISPAKTLDFETPALTDEYTLPSHLTQSQQLINQLREFSAAELSKLMKVSDNIGDLNQRRFQQWQTPFKPQTARQALFTFKGGVYIGIDVPSMSQKNLHFAQKYLRILSGLYGILRPLDLMQAYRLEMGTRLATDRGVNLYQFWNNIITSSLNAELEKMNSETLINLASIEYFKSVKTNVLKAEIITPVFKDYTKGSYKVIGFFAKKARGLMTRYMIDKEITDAEQLKDFDREGYALNIKLSTQQEWVFTRRL